jgi:hypothetical protein
MTAVVGNHQHRHHHPVAFAFIVGAPWSVPRLAPFCRFQRTTNANCKAMFFPGLMAMGRVIMIMRMMMIVLLKGSRAGVIVMRSCGSSHCGTPIYIKS